MVRGGSVLQGPYTVVVDDPELDADLEIRVDAHDGRLAVNYLVLRRRPEGPAPSAATLRKAALDTYVARSLDLLPPGHLGAARALDGGGVLVSPALGARGPEAVRQMKRGLSRPRNEEARHKQLALVAALYREALALAPGQDPDGWRRRPTEYVAERARYTRGHAGRLLTEARAQGLLGPAERGKPGEKSEA